ncbi:methionine sulfoxide reductase [Betaproteobacteria bacterium]|nr:methionine sulfoxide reductase [Betaproteobacteria bacterium]
MAVRGKSINLFLMDGTASGRIKCTLANWTGVAYKIPRTELEKCKERDDLKQSGVYFLFGRSEQTGDEIVYIGQAGIRKNGEGILYRLQEHKRNPDKDYWTEAIVFTTSNNSFGPTEISYLESRFCNLATEAKRYEVKNANDPTSGNITEEKESELEEFIDYAKIVMGTLGHKVFEGLTQQTTSGETTAPTVEAVVIFEFKRADASVRGQRTSEGFVLLQGSKISQSIKTSCPESVKKSRERYAPKIDKDGVLLVDILFHSPNEAASFAVAGTINAQTAWQTVDGQTLKGLESSEIDGGNKKDGKV